KASIGKYLYDKGAFVDTAELDQLKNGEIGEFIGVEDGRLAAGADKVLTTTAQVHQTRDDYQGEIAIRRDLDDTLGISSVQGGNVESTIHSATDIATVARGAAGRHEKELSRGVDFYRCGAGLLFRR